MISVLLTSLRTRNPRLHQVSAMKEACCLFPRNLDRGVVVVKSQGGGGVGVCVTTWQLAARSSAKFSPSPSPSPSISLCTVRIAVDNDHLGELGVHL
jgi:hypothetical protein